MPSIKIYKLFEVPRFFGNETERSKSHYKHLICSHSNMCELVHVIMNDISYTKSYIIEKYINDVVQIRQLTCMDDAGRHVHYCYTTTWEKYFWNNDKWTISAFRMKRWNIM